MSEKSIKEPKSVLVTGANRGIGLGFVQKFIEFKNIQYIFAGCRNPESAEDLKKITDPRVHIIQLDVTNDSSIDGAFKKISDIVGPNGLTLLLNNAGIWSKYEFTDEPNREKIVEQFNVNSASPLIMMQKFFPLLQKAANLREGSALSIDRAAIVNISSTAASIEKIDGHFNGPLVIYRMSKAALNSASKSFSVDMRATNILISTFCPGFVKTDMSGPDAFLTVEEACNNLVNSILRLDEDNHGKFVDQHLNVIPN